MIWINRLSPIRAEKIWFLGHLKHSSPKIWTHVPISHWKSAQLWFELRYPEFHSLNDVFIAFHYEILMKQLLETDQVKIIKVVNQARC